MSLSRLIFWCCPKKFAKENRRTLPVAAPGRPHRRDRSQDVDTVAEVMDTFDRDDFLKVKGIVQVYQNRSQFTIHKLRRLEEHEVDSPTSFPSSDRDPEEMFAELRGIVNGFTNPHLQGAGEFGV